MPLQKPLLLYDGDCGFCQRWVARWRRLTGERVSYVPYQGAATPFPSIPRERLAEAVHLVEPDGRISSGAQAVFRTLAYGGKRWPLWCYRHLFGIAPVSEWFYRFIAAHRGRGGCRVPHH